MGNQSANLFFKNLDPTITSKKLEEDCSKFGSIISCVVKVDEESNKPLGYGYVQFETPQHAEECVNAMNNIKLGEKNISVSLFLPKNKRQNPFAKSNLYIKQFPMSWTKEEVEIFVHETFEIYGTISSSGIFEDKNIQKKYAFVAFEEQEAAQKALVELNEYEITPEDKLYVAYAQDKATRRRTLKSKHMKFKNETNLYVKSLKPDVDEGKIMTAFEKYGKVTSVCIKVHEAKNAFTECKKDPAVLNCIDQNLNTRGTEFIYYAQTKTVRQQYLRMQKKNMKTFKLIHDNVLQYYQLMKYFMPQNFRGNQRNPRGQNQRGSNGKFNNNYPKKPYQTRGQYSGGNRDQQQSNNMPFNNMNHMMNNMNNMNNMSTPLPNQGNTPAPTGQGNTPSPNMMFDNMGLMSQNMPGMANMNIMQQQMIGQNMGVNQQGGMVQMPQGMNMMQGNNNQPQPNQPVRDLDWLKRNLESFEKLDNHEKKNILGNLMYPLVEENVNNPEHVPKITGMLIDLEVLRANEIVEIMENQEALKDRIDEAIGIINDTE